MRVTSSIRTRRFLVVFGGFLCGFAIASTDAWAGGGNVQPPGAKPHGYTLTDMSFLSALFVTSGNNLGFYPNTPIQILFVSATNEFFVAPGTPFYVPVFYVDDSPPAVGTFPTNAKQAPAYWFDPSQLGAVGLEVIVDGKSTPLGPNYVVGPVTTAPLLDGGGTHISTIGVFLTPLTPGTHTVEIKGTLAGAAVLALTGGTPFGEDITYTVHVVPHGR